MPDRHKVVAKLIKDGLVLKKGAEIGVWKGSTSRYLLNTYADLQMVCVDPYKVYPEEINPAKGMNFKRQQDFDKRYDEVVKDFRKRFPSRVQWIREPSVEAAIRIKDNSLDFVFIDANHAYEYVKADILAWRPKVRAGGIVCGHDWSIEEVQKAVTATIEDAKRVGKNCWFKCV